jgi:hypothetical protein
MNEDRMDELLIKGAQDYNEPGSVPREEMWTRIAAARQAAARGSSGAPPSAAPKHLPWIKIALAAGIVFAIGLGIGMRLDRSAAPSSPAVAVNSPTTPRDTVRTTSPDTIVPQLREETLRTDRRVRELASVGAPKTDRGDDAPNADLAYRLVMLRHVAGSEAMITAFRASARRGEVDTQIAAWARELLGTTRLLESSPVADDPMMKRLLEDLDLVLLQISRYVTRGTVDTEELDLIEESINKRGVITKLRSTLPARNTPAGS